MNRRLFYPILVAFAILCNFLLKCYIQMGEVEWEKLRKFCGPVRVTGLPLIGWQLSGIKRMVS